MFKGMTQRAVHGVTTIGRKSKVLVAAGAIAVIGASTSALAAGNLTAADVDMSGTKADILLVFLAIFAVVITIFGYRKIMAIGSGH